MAHDASVPLRLSAQGGPMVPGPVTSGGPAAVPSPARVWRHWLGAGESQEADRGEAERLRARWPEAVRVARTSRHFVIRALRYLAEEEGLRQFLDAGCGLPTVDNTHEIVQRADPSCRVVYTDSDPAVREQAGVFRGGSTPQGAVDCVTSDVRRPEEVLRAASATLDLSRPVAVVLGGVLGHVAGDDEAADAVRRLTGPLAVGSCLVLYDGVAGPAVTEPPGYRLRTPAQIAAFLGGLDPVPPGVVPVSQWRPEISPFGDGETAGAWGGVARKR